MRRGSNAEPDHSDSGAPLQDAGGGRQSTPLHQSLWLWVIAGFFFVAILWTAMFLATRQADTRTVPLATQGGRP